VYNPIYSSSNSSYVKLHLYNAVRQYGSIGPQFFFDEINQLLSVPNIFVRSLELHGGCLVIVAVRHSTSDNHESCIWQLWDVTSRFFAPVRYPKSVAGPMLPHLPFFLASRTSLAHFFKNISIHCRRMYSALSKFSKGSQVSKFFKKSATAISQYRGPTRNGFNRNGPRIIDWCFISRNPATLTFFHLLNALKLGYPILLANYFKENSVCFKLIGALPSAPPKSDELSIS